MSFNEQDRKRFRKMVVMVITIQAALMLTMGVSLIFTLLKVGF